MNKEKYLPLGTVVLLKGAEHRLMIIGYCPSDPDMTKIYDYTAVFYPEGVIKLDNSLVFNHDQIDKVYFSGYFDDEAQKFQEKMKEALKVVENAMKDGGKND